MFENIGVVAGMEGVTVIHGSSWKAAEFNKTGSLWQTAYAAERTRMMTSPKTTCS
jgi:hypothetical protein